MDGDNGVKRRTHVVQNIFKILLLSHSTRRYTISRFKGNFLQFLITGVIQSECSLMGYPWSPLSSGYSPVIPEQDCWVVVGLHHIDPQPVIAYPVIPNIGRYGTQHHTAVLPLLGLISVAYWWMLEWLGRCTGSQLIGSRATTRKMLSTVTMKHPCSG